MSEGAPEYRPEPGLDELDTYLVGDLPLRFWFDYLSHDQEDLHTRYGHTGEEVAWWSIGVGCIINARSEHPGDAAELMDFSMVACVSNDRRVLKFVLENWVLIPDVVKDKINESGRRNGFWN